MTSGAATIDWQANSGNDFLTSTSTQNFTSSSGVNDYTVLNRVTPNGSGPISINGTVASTIGGTATKGGNIWFYSPGGIVVGASAVFDVGGLLLTSLTPNLTSNSANGFSASFSTNTDAGDGGPIQIISGAKINALQQNSYIALVAPRIEQGGDVHVNGSAAYVAANTLTMTMNQGLFDIQVPIDGGTDDDNGVVHTGTTTFTQSSGAGDNRRIYMVAVPKNQALTMLLNGTMGFDADAASLDNGQIILSGGTSIQDTAEGINGSAQAGLDASITIGHNKGMAAFNADVYAIANGTINADAATGDVTFARDANLRNVASPGSGNIILSASSLHTLSVGRDLQATSVFAALPSTVEMDAVTGGQISVGGNATLTSAPSADGTVGSVNLYADGGGIDIAGTALVFVDADAFQASTEASSLDHTAGTIDIAARNGGSISAGAMDLRAVGSGDANNGGGDGVAGDGFGGRITVSAGTDSTINVTGNVSADASGIGGDMFIGATQGGLGRGGSVLLQSNGGALHIGGTVDLTASGQGGSYVDEGAAVTGPGGEGDGGYAQVFSSGGSVKIDGTTTAIASGTGGTGANGGLGKGGHAGVSDTGGSITLGADTTARAEGSGGNAVDFLGGTGGNGQGGVAYIEADSNLEGGTSGTITGTTATISSNASGGAGGSGNGDNIVAGAGGSATGGQYTGFDTGGAFALADINGAALTLTDVTVSSWATGGAGGIGMSGQVGGDGGVAVGGTAQAGTYNRWGITDPPTGSANFGNVTADASATGGAGGAGNGAGNGGAGTGGAAVFGATGATSAHDVTLRSDGQGGAGGIGGAGNGGSGDSGGVLLYVTADQALTITGNIELDLLGFGGNGSTGSGGVGTGGDVDLSVATGARLDGGMDGDLILAAGDITIFNKGQGGDGGASSTGGDGGAGWGGSTVMTIDGTLKSSSIDVFTRGVGGTGGHGGDGYGGNGGLGYGGINDLTVAGSLTADTYTASMNGSGGNAGTGTSGSGYGGDGHGGTNTVTIDGGVAVGGSLTTDTTSGFVVTAYAEAGDGRSGGYATGGDSSITVNGSLSAAGIVQASAQAGLGGGGNGSNGYGGGARGGTASITVSGDLSAGAIFVGSNALAGNGSGAAGESGGGTAFGGTALLELDGGSLDVADWVLIQSNATGGNADAGNGGNAYAGFPCDCEGSGDGAVFVSIGGAATIHGDLNLESIAQGGLGVNGGYAAGGYAALSAYSGGLTPASGTIAVDGVTKVKTDGTGGNGTIDGTGGNGDGGFAFVDVSDGSITVANAVIAARGTGGNGGLGGDGSGGIVNVGITDAGGSLTFSGGSKLTATGTGGNGLDNPDGLGGTGGIGTGGSAQLTTNGVLLDGATAGLALGDITIDAFGVGGDGGDGITGGTAGAGEGGGAYLNLGAVAATAGTIIENAGAAGGLGGNGSDGVGGIGGEATGGAVVFTIDAGASIDGSLYTATTTATGGDGGTERIGQRGRRPGDRRVEHRHDRRRRDLWRHLAAGIHRHRLWRGRRRRDWWIGHRRQQLHYRQRFARRLRPRPEHRPVDRRRGHRYRRRRQWRYGQPHRQRRGSHRRLAPGRNQRDRRQGWHRRRIGVGRLEQLAGQWRHGAGYQPGFRGILRRRRHRHHRRDWQRNRRLSRCRSL